MEPFSIGEQSVSGVVKILTESNVERKSEVFRSLACAGGRPRIFDCLTEWTVRTNSCHKFQPVVNEIVNHCATVEYGISIVTFINSLISSCNDRSHRIRIRNEFLGLKLQSALDKLSFLASSKKDTKGSELLLKQLDIFNELRLFDDVGEMTGAKSVDLNSHADIFYAILKQVSQTPNEIAFLNILQHLLQLDPGETMLRNYVWETVEKLVCRAKLLDSKEEAEKLFLRPHPVQQQQDDAQIVNNCCHCSCHREQSNATTSESTKLRPGSVSNHQPAVLPPNAPPPPPQLPFLGANQQRKTKNSSFTNFVEAINKTTLRKTPNPNTDTATSSYSDSSHSVQQQADNVKIFNFINQVNSQQSTVANSNAPVINAMTVGMKPKQKLKQFAWNKVPIAKVVSNRDNIWIKAARNFHDDQYALDFDVLEELFAQCSPPNTMERRQSTSSASPNSSQNYANSNGNINGERKKRDSVEINLLDPKRSLNVNIFLRQFRGDIKDFTEIIQTGNGVKIGLEKLRSLMKIMPELDEIESLSNYSEDKSKLGSAERFFMALIEIPNYRLRVESMLLKEEFSTLVDYIKPSVDIILKAAQELKSNSSLHEVMYLVLMIGNYLNSGTYGGNAVGFKMTSLWKLVEIRANKPNVTLLHYVVMEVEKKNSSLLRFPKEMKYVEEASKLPIETVATDYRLLKEKTERISKQLQNANCLALSIQMNDFLEYAKSELSKIEQQMKTMERLRMELALFLCEDPQAFKLEDCFKIFYNFSLRFNKAIDENNERKVQEEKCELRKRQTAEQKTKAKESVSNVVRRSLVIDSDLIDQQQSINADFDANRFLRHRADVTPNGVGEKSRHVFSNTFNSSSLSRTKPDFLLLNNAGTADVFVEKDKTVENATCESAPLNKADFSTENAESKKSFRRRASAAPAINNDRDRPSQSRFHSIDGGVPLPEKNPSSSSGSITECLPVFSKPFHPVVSSKSETARISSVSDLRLLRPALVVTSSSSFGRGLDAVADDGVSPSDISVGREFENSNFTTRFGNSFSVKKSSTPTAGWFDRNRKRSNSLHLLCPPSVVTSTIVGGANSRGENLNCSPDDLGELLTTLETEKRLNDIGRRRNIVNRRRRFNNTNEPSCLVSDGDVGNECQHQSLSPNLSFWRKNSTPNVSEFEYEIRTDSRNMEKSQDYADSRNMQINRSTVATSKDYNDNKIIDFNKLSNDLIVSSGKHNQDPTLSISTDVSKIDSSTSPKENFKMADNKAIAWQSYSDQSDARSTESPTESVCEHDEGFETESHSTICSGEQRPLTPLCPVAPDNGAVASMTSSSNNSSIAKHSASSSVEAGKKENNSTVISNNKIPAVANNGKFEYRINVPKFMTGTKASLARAMTSSGSSTTLKVPVETAKSKTTPSSGNFVKRMIESISSKKSSSKFPSPKIEVKRKSLSETSTKTSNTEVKQFGRAKLQRSNATAVRRSSSSSLSNSPGRSNVIAVKKLIELPVGGKRNSKQPHSKSAKILNGRDNDSVDKNNDNNVNKQRIMQMRTRLKQAKENGGSSTDSDKGPPPRRLPPRTLKTLAAKTAAGNNVRKISTPANIEGKTWERLKSPPKNPAKASSDRDELKCKSKSPRRESNRRQSNDKSAKVPKIPTDGRRSSSGSNENSVAMTTSKPWR